MSSVDNVKSLKRKQILAAALIVFSRYGYKRTTMNDIAQNTGISRAALYLYYKNKEEIFRSLAYDLHEKALAAAKQALGLQAPFATRLLTAFRGKNEEFSVIYDSPHGEELIELGMQVTADLASQAEADYIALFATFFEKAESNGEIDLAPLNLRPATCAEYLIKSSYGLKMGKPTIDQMQERLEKLIRIFVTAVLPNTTLTPPVSSVTKRHDQSQ